MAQALHVNGLPIVVDTDPVIGPARQDLNDIQKRFAERRQGLPARAQQLTHEHCVTALLLLPPQHQTVAVVAEILKISSKTVWRKIAPLKKRLGMTHKAHFMRLLADKMAAQSAPLGQRQGFEELAERVGAYLRRQEQAPTVKKKAVTYPGAQAVEEAILALPEGASHRALASRLGCTQPAISSQDGWLIRTFGHTNLKAIRARLQEAAVATPVDPSRSGAL